MLSSGWEIELLAHTLRDALAAQDGRFRGGAVDQEPRSIGDLKSAVEHVSIEIAVLRAILGELRQLWSQAALEEAIGKPGEPGDPERIRHLAGEIGAHYGLILCWANSVRSISVPSAASSLYEVLASYAVRPAEQLHTAVNDFVTSARAAVRALRAGDRTPRDLALHVRLTPDLDAEQALQHELARVAALASAPAPHSRQPFSPSSLRPTTAPHGLGPAEALAKGRTLRAGEFAAIDFETATRFRASACGVGVAMISGGEVAATRRWLIQPPGNEYEPINISIHGITPAMTATSPGFGEVWTEVAEMIGELPVIAHYAAFDIGVLRASLTGSEKSWPDLRYYCTCALSRRAWPGWLSYRLEDVAHACGVKYSPHDPVDDARAAGELAVAICGATGCRSIFDASQELGVWPGELSANDWLPCGVHGSGAHPKYSTLRPTVDDIDEDGRLYGRTVVFTGTMTHWTRDQAAQVAVNAGAHVSNNISRKVDYLVCGLQDAAVVKDGVHSGKMIAATELNSKGAHIQLVSEADFYRMLHA